MLGRKAKARAHIGVVLASSSPIYAWCRTQGTTPVRPVAIRPE